MTNERQRRSIKTCYFLEIEKHITCFQLYLSLGGGLGRLLGLLSLLGLLGGLSGDSDTGDTTAGDGDVLEEGAEVSVVADGKSEGAGGDAARALGDGLAGEFEGFSGQVLEGGGEEDGGTGGDAAGEAALAEHGTNAASREGEAGLVGGLLDGLLSRLARSGHVESFFCRLFFVKIFFL